ncbi:unnamed protein product [Blepharisma stoltei]|uniref:Polycystin cation channel PKD1/PKD2 domain-containing protein n=1 Tax=Blepharisma stoltei TaxID=1481888 RepID=A0AAU9IUH6_9CILI|nr:unnamed protein product [Blepharisma stoltei]
METETFTEHKDSEESKLSHQNEVIRALGKHYTQYAEGLITKGVVSQATMDKIKKIRQNPNIARAEKALANGELELALDFAMMVRHSQPDEIYVESGNFVEKAIKLEHYEFAKSLLERGYGLPPNLFINAISDKNTELVNRLIQEGLYYQENSVEVEFWFLLYCDFVDSARLLLEKEASIKHLCKNFTIDSKDNISSFLKDNEVIDTVITIALQRKLDHIACIMLTMNPNCINKNMIYIALETSCIGFIKIVWTGNYTVKEVAAIKTRLKNSVIWQKLDQELVDIDERREMVRKLKVSFIIEKLLAMKKIQEVDEVLDWPGACDEVGIVNVLMLSGQQSLARKCVQKCLSGITTKDFTSAFEEGLFELCVDMLRFKEAATALEDEKIQEDIIKIIENGDSCLQAVEMLNAIPNKEWYLEHTKDLTNNLYELAVKKKEILICQAPILFCALTAEFLTRLSSASLEHQNRCIETANLYIDLGAALIESILEEPFLNFYMNQQDSSGRTVLSIAADNGFYKLLESEGVGSIVQKLWNGEKEYYDVMKASSIHQSLMAPLHSEDCFKFLKRLDKDVPYMFHFERWLDSCSLRFMAQGISTVFLLIIYNLLIYYAIENNSFLDVTDNSHSEFCLRIAQVWIFGIITEQIQQYIFGWKTGRGYTFDNWRMLDIIMFGCMILISMSLGKKYMGEGNRYPDADPVLFNACMHSIVVTLIWLRFMGVLLTHKAFGPILQMIYIVITQIIHFFVLWFSLIFCFAAIFACLFSETNPDFPDFTYSVRNLFSATLLNFSFDNFGDQKTIGALLLGGYVLISYAVLLNILIAMVCNVYYEVEALVDAEHRAVVIAYYDRWVWDETYGGLIFAPSPLSFLVLLASPFILFSRDPKKWNIRVAKVFYLFFALPQFVVFVVHSLFLLLFLYFKAFIFYPKESKKIENSRIRKIGGGKIKRMDTLKIEKLVYKYNILRCIIWFFIGIPCLLWAVLRDCYDFWANIYYVHKDPKEEQEKVKISRVINQEMIKNVHRVLEDMVYDEITVNEFVENWMAYDIIDKDISTKDLIERKQRATDFLVQFSESLKHTVINIPKMRRLLPKQPNEEYTEDYIKRVRFINVPWLSKGLKNFQDEMGSITIGDVTVPKDSGVSGGPLDVLHIRNIEITLEMMDKKHAELANTIETIRRQMEEQKKIAAMLRGRESNR